MKDLIWQSIILKTSNPSISVLLFESIVCDSMKVSQTVAEAKKCFGENVIKHSLLIITKYHDRVPVRAKEALEH